MRINPVLWMALTCLIMVACDEVLPVHTLGDAYPEVSDLGVAEQPDATGKPEATDPTALVECEHTPRETRVFPVPAANAKLILPPDYRAAHHEGVGATLSSADGRTVGFVMAVDSAGSLADAALRMQPRLLDAGWANWSHGVGKQNQVPSPEWYDHRITEALPDRFEVTVAPPTFTRIVGYEGLEASDTPMRTLNVETLESVAGVTGLTPVEPAYTCDGLVLLKWAVSDWWDGSRLLSVVLICNANDVGPRSPLEQEGWVVLVPENALPTAHCERYAFPPLPIYDVLVVIDNSPSMVDELPNVRAVLRRSLEAWRAMGVGEIRVAITTTEAYQLADGSIERDELLDAETGLRGGGFKSTDAADFDAWFEAVLFADEGCASLGVDGSPQPNGLNLCGSENEDGIKSATFAYRRLLVDSRPEYQMRPRAKQVLLIVSDEDAASLRGVPPSEVQELAEPDLELMQSLRVELKVMVGDVGVSGGGLCSPKAESERSSGTEPGTGYVEFAHRLGGANGSICAPENTLALSPVIADPLASRALKLRRFPHVGTLRLVLDGQEYDAQGEPIYEFDTNGVWPSMARVVRDTKVEIAYTEWRLPQ